MLVARMKDGDIFVVYVMQYVMKYLSLESGKVYNLIRNSSLITALC